MISSFVAANVIGLIVCPFPKHVELGEDELIIVSPIRRHSISLSLADIADVRHAWFTRQIVLAFRVDTAFGRKITFMPRMQLLPAIFGHPDIRELKEKVANAHRTH